MLRGLPGIRHKSVQLGCTVLVTSQVLALAFRGSSIFGIDLSNAVFGFGSNISSFTWFI